MTEKAPTPAATVIDANVAVHSAMASTYNEREPHFRPENQAAVAAVLADLGERAGGGRLLDLGCGTGFILNLARDHFSQLDGVDITQAMLDRVDLSSGNIRLHNQPVESLPFADGTFDAATAYSFLDHLEDIEAVLREAARVMKPGAVFYADLLPNRRFWNAVHEAGERAEPPKAPWVAREVSMLKSQHEMVERDYAIAGEDFLNAEPWKNKTRGIDAAELEAQGLRAGFSKVDVQYQWFLGQGNLMHGSGAGEGPEALAAVQAYLGQVMPLAEPLFKYLRVFLTR